MAKAIVINLEENMAKMNMASTAYLNASLMCGWRGSAG